MHPWITGRIVEERRRSRLGRRRPNDVPSKPPRASWRRGWFDRVVPAESGPTRLRARPSR